MVSVTGRIKSWKQPHGGYVPVRTFDKTDFSDGMTLEPFESVHGSIMGLAVDYLTRVELGEAPEEAFRVSLRGAERIGESERAQRLLARIEPGMNTATVKSACKLSGYDVIVRSGPLGFQPVTWIEADRDTMKNIRTMVRRTQAFFDQSMPIKEIGFNLIGGYTDTVTSGDGDYLLTDAVVDLKVSKSPITSKDTLQLLMYALMGRRAFSLGFSQVEYIEIFNPRQNRLYSRKLSSIPKDVIREVESDVIGYGARN